ncbi:MAG: hypothetical protein P1U32_06405 [Legionellaceae bacterium]|nr:hypothetical protein [Legionellaceae bacterium]
MAVMEQATKQAYLALVEKQLDAIRALIENDMQDIIETSWSGEEFKQNEVSAGGLAYQTYLFEGDNPPYHVFRQAIEAAVSAYAESECKFSDEVAQYEAIKKALDAFIKASGHEKCQLTEKRLGGSGFYGFVTGAQNTPRPLFLLNARKNIFKVCVDIAAKLGVGEQALNKAIVAEENYKEKSHPLVALYDDILKATGVYADSQCRPEDAAQFKAAIEAATDACVARYKGKVDPTALDYVKAAGLFIVGVIVGLATFYALPYKPYRDFVKSTFFSPVESKVVDTKKSQAVQTVAQEGKLADTLGEAPAYVPVF